MLADYKIWIGIIAAVMTLAAHIPYLIDTWRGTNKPHMFTWIIWTLLTFIMLAAQVTGGAGAGAWSTGMVLIPCGAIMFLSFTWRGEKDITRSDWIMFVAGIASIPLWAVTDDPLWSVVLICAIDALAFGPTFRKAWRKPHEEATFMYGLNVPRHALATLAISHYSLVTALYPVMLVVMNAAMYLMLKLRRRTILT